MASPTMPPRESRPGRHQDRGSERSSKPVPTYAHSDSEDSEGGPQIPIRRPGQPRYTGDNNSVEEYSIPPGFQTYPVQEVDSKKKRAATLGLGATRVILLPDKSTRPKEEWGVQNLTSYNSEGKHVFIELKNPDRSLDLHAGSKDAAEEIISALSEIRGAHRQTGLEEVVAAATGGKKRDIGTILYDFQAKGDDEVSVIVGDEVIIIDATSEEWWLVERRVNGERGVVPASYIERGRSTVVSSGIMASPADPRERAGSQRSSNGGRIPMRTSSLAGNHHRPEGRRGRLDSVASSDKAQATSGKQSMLQSSRSRYRKSGTWGAVLLTAIITEPDSSQVRQWTDRTGNFKVEAQFIGYKDGKINLHKLNGVKIAVPVGKMSLEDLEYVERRAGISLDEVKPVSAFTQKNRKPQTGISFEAPPSKPVSTLTASSQLPSAIATSAKPNSYDWFEFFLSCGVDVGNCQRYATAFDRDSMDEAVLEDIQPEVMRMLGLKEGDILRVKKKLDEKFGRTKKNGAKLDEDREEGSGSLFSGPGGTLKNNTRKGRPAPAVQTPGSVDPEAFKQKNDSKSPRASPAPTSRSPPPGQVAEMPTGGFDDDAWSPKPTTSKPQSPAPQQPPRITSPAATAAPPPQPAPVELPAPTGALGDLLSLNSPPLQPTVASPPPQSAPAKPTPQIQQPPVTQPPVSQPLPSFMNSQVTGMVYGAGTIPTPPMPNQFNTQFNGMNQPNQYALGRTRPMAPTITGANSGGLSIPPPPQRPGSAPQNFTPGMSLPPLTPSYTGQPMMSNYGQMGTQPMPFQNMGMPAPMTMQPTSQMFQNMNNSLMPHNTGMPYMNMVGQAPTSGIQQPMPQNPIQAPIITQPTGMLQNNFGQHQPLGFQPNMNTGRGIGINSFLPPPLVPTATGAPQQFAGAKPLVPQPTGPPPNVKFGVNQAKKLVPQPTGRADLSKASMFSSLTILGREFPVFG